MFMFDLKCPKCGREFVFEQYPELLDKGKCPDCENTFYWDSTGEGDGESFFAAWASTFALIH